MFVLISVKRLERKKSQNKKEMTLHSSSIENPKTQKKIAVFKF